MAAKKKISEQELITKVKDLDVSDEELAGYFIVDEENSKAFSPVVIPNPDLVDDSREGAAFLNLFNRLAKIRRNRIYKRRIKNWDGVRIVAEGDSWFQYPLLLKDTIDQLNDLDNFRYAIYGLSEAGDLLSQIIVEDEITEAIEREKPDVFLISGGGNDMVGDSRMATLVHKYAANRKPENYPNERFNLFLNELETLYRGLFSRLLADRPHLKIICHGYDKAIPSNGTWLGKPLAMQNIKDAGLQRQIVAVMISRFNECLKSLVSEFRGSVFHVDCQDLIGEEPDWHDELHPKNEGYFKVAQRFDEMIQHALAVPGPSSSVRLNTALEAASLKPAKADIRLSKVRKLDNREFEKLVVSRAASLTGTQPQAPASRTERKKIEEDISEFFEKIHKEANFLPSSFLERGVERAKSVCRITTDTSYGSGFLLATRQFIMTNNHVLPDRETAEVSIAEFDYDEDAELYTIRFRPDSFFITDEDLDFTIVACDPAPLPQDITAIPLLQDSNTVTRGERVNIVQHPQGRPKEVSLHDNKVGYVYDVAIRYSADTEGGSSGSPVFNNDWDLVALHHAGWKKSDGSAENEGIRIASIVQFLKSLSGGESGRGIERLLEHIASPGDKTSQPGGTCDPACIPSSPSRAERSRAGKNVTLNIDSSSDNITINIR